MVDKLDRWIKQRFQSYNVIWKIQNVLIWKVDCDIMDEFFFAGLREFNGNNERWERARWVVSLTLSLCHVLSPGFRTFFSPCLILSSPSFSSKCFTIYHIFHAIVFPCIYFIIFSFSSSFLFFCTPSQTQFGFKFKRILITQEVLQQLNSPTVKNQRNAGQKFREEWDLSLVLE